MSKGNPFLAVRLAPEAMEALSGVCRAEGIPVSEGVRTALREYLATRACPEYPTVSAPTAKTQMSTRRPSRPARLQKLQQQARELLDDYLTWRDAMPENLEASPTAERLQDTTEALEQACDVLDAIEPPRGYGRD